MVGMSFRAERIELNMRAGNCHRRRRLIGQAEEGSSRHRWRPRSRRAFVRIVHNDTRCRSPIEAPRDSKSWRPQTARFRISEKLGGRRRTIIQIDACSAWRSLLPALAAKSSIEYRAISVGMGRTLVALGPEILTIWECVGMAGILIPHHARGNEKARSVPGLDQYLETDLEGQAAVPQAFRFLRKLSRPNAPRPPAKSGRAAGSGVVKGV